MKPAQVYRVEFVKPLNVSGYQIQAGQVIRSELIGRGTNWIKLQLPRGPVKTLFNFECKWTVAN